MSTLDEEYDPYDPEDDFQHIHTLTAEQHLNTYSSLFDTTCVNQPDLAFASFHLLLGSLPAIRELRIIKGASRLDPRLHVFYIAPSGSGKGAAINFIAACGQAANLIMQSCGAITSNALTGTREKKDKPKEGDTDFERWQMTDGYLNPDAMPSNIVFFTEAAELITTKPAPDMRKCLDHFQKAMNPYRTEDNRISKKTALGPEITFFPNTSLFYTTYKPTELAEVITQRGFLQRCLFLIRDVSIDERFEDIIRVNRLMDSPQIDTSPISNLFNRINKFYQDHPSKDINIDKTVLPSVDAHLKYFQRVLRNCNNYIQDRLVDFIPRFNDIYWKLAMHSCILRQSHTINEEDISYAGIVLRDRFIQTLEFLQKNIPVPREVTQQQEQLYSRVMATFNALQNKTNQEWFPIDRLRAILVKNKFFITEREAHYFLLRLSNAGILTVRDKSIRVQRKLRKGEMF